MSLTPLRAFLGSDEPRTSDAPTDRAHGVRRSALPIGLGTLAAVAFVLLEGHTHVVPGVTPPSRWFGALAVLSPTGRALAATVAWAAVLLLGWCWYRLARAAAADQLRLRVAAVAGALWGAPFLLGPPLTSLDMYSYAAHGRLSANGLSPYVAPPAALGPGPVLDAVDPRWHHVLSPYGPLATLLEHACAVVGRTPLGTVVALRLVAALAAVVAVGCAVALTRASSRARTMTLLGLNPLFLTTTLSAAHLEAVMLALLLAGLYAWRRQRPVLALVLVVAAGLVKAPALAAVPFLVVENWRGSPRRALTAARDTGTVVAALAVGGWLVPHGWAWTDTVLHTPATGREWWTPSTLLAEIGAGIGHVLGIDVTTGDLIGITRSAGLLVTAALLVWLLFRRGDVLLRIGAGTTLLAVLGFVLYPWYLLWGWPLLVIAGRRRLAMTASTVACCFTLANLWPQQREAAALWRAARDSPVRAVGVLLVLTAVVAAIVTARRRSGVRSSEQPAGADRVAAGVGDVEHHPTVVVDDPARRSADRAAQGQGGTPPQP